MAKEKFATKIGLIAATVGSAVGLGNIWRFPAEAQSNGGAAFLLIYILCVFILGVPVMLSEFALGREGQSDAEDAYRKLSPGKKWWIGGAMGILASYMILCFYMVVAGWTLEYLWGSLTGDLYAAKGNEQYLTAKMHQYVSEGYNSLIATFIVIFANLIILILGVRKGIEKMSNVMMPMLFALLLIFCVVALMLPEAGTGLKFFFNPDFSKITPEVVINALGQSFFSLSLGMGVLVTYSSYYPKDVKLGETAVTVSLLDLLVAILMGVIIFPAVTSFGLGAAGMEGTTLVFVTLPEVFAHIPGTDIWSVLFFLLLFVAALTSTISVAEVSVSWLEDKYKKTRTQACLLVLCPTFILSGLCALSFGILSDWKIFGMSMFDFLDSVTTNLMLPIVALIGCIYMGWFAPKGVLKKQLTNNGKLSNIWYSSTQFILRYIAPVLIILILVTALFK